MIQNKNEKAHLNKVALQVFCSMVASGSFYARYHDSEFARRAFELAKAFIQEEKK